MIYSDTRWKVTCETFNSTILFVCFIFSLVHLLLVALSLCCCVWVFSNWGVWGLLSRCSEWASLCLGFSCWGAWALDTPAPVAAVHGLRSCGTQT